MTIRDEIVAAMTRLGAEPDVLFWGYNVKYGNAGGSLNEVPEDRKAEAPLCENLMLGSAIGLSLSGYVPIVFFERADFMLCAMDALVCHIDKLEQLSDGLHKPGVIIRAVVGNSKAPLFTGITHTQNPYEALKKLVKMPVYLITKSKQVESYYNWALESARRGKSTIIIEEKDTYGNM